jgi:deazaflavin-dependent oxidoreductase (nitroreductase family)
MAENDSFNDRIIAEFRANAGKVGGSFSRASMVLITTTGARSGNRRTTPLVYLPDGDNIVIFASKGGAPKHPDWYHNLCAHPEITVEVGGEVFQATATVAEGAEHDRLYAEQARRFPIFADYQAKATRKIPVVVLTRKR